MQRHTTSSLLAYTDWLRAQSRAYINCSCHRRTAVYCSIHSLSPTKTRHCKSLSHTRTYFFCAGVCSKKKAPCASAQIENPCHWCCQITTLTPWLIGIFCRRQEPLDWQSAYTFDTVIRMRLASCYWLNAFAVIIFPYVTLVDMKSSQATASGEVITSDKASILDLACAILHYLAKPNF